MLELLIHRRAFLGSVHVVIAQAAQDPGEAIESSDSSLSARLSAMAESAPADERSRAAADIRLFAVHSPDRCIAADLLGLTH